MTRIPFPDYARLTPMGGFLRAVDAQIMGSTPAPKMTPRQSRRARKRERRREKFAYRYDAPFNVIETVDLDDDFVADRREDLAADDEQASG